MHVSEITHVLRHQAHKQIHQTEQGIRNLSVCITYVTWYGRYTWLDSDTIIANVIPEGQGKAPERPPAPTGPRIQDNAGGAKVWPSSPLASAGWSREETFAWQIRHN